MRNNDDLNPADAGEALTVLTSFGNIGSAERAARAAEDIAAATGLPVRQAALDLGRALSDPTHARLSKFYLEIDGTALRGHLDEDQNVILDAVESQVGGAGDSARKYAELNRAWCELGRTLARGLRLEAIVAWLARKLDRQSKHGQ